MKSGGWNRVGCIAQDVQQARVNSVDLPAAIVRDHALFGGTAQEVVEQLRADWAEKSVLPGAQQPTQVLV